MSYPKMPKDLASYSRPIWIIVRNESQFKLNQIDEHLEHGVFNGETPSTQPFSVNGFGVRNVTTFLWIGYRPLVGVSFRVRLDENTTYDFSIVSPRIPFVIGTFELTQ